MSIHLTTNVGIIVAAFLTPTLAKVAKNQKAHSYKYICVVQTELNNNAMSIASGLGDGEHGHIFLTLTAADFLVQTGTAYITQVVLTVSPVRQANITGPQIAGTIRH